MLKPALALSAILLIPAALRAEIIANQPPGTLTARWSKLWVDPSPAGNNLDGDAICYQDFTLSRSTPISHIEWWGKPDQPGYAGQPNKGFQIEFWKQDPGTIAYQPLAVFRDSGAKPTAAFTTTDYTASAGPNGLDHFSLDLATPITLPANDATNPRWFIAVIGLTDVAYLEWDWAQGSGVSNHSFQFIRGGNDGGDRFQSLGEGRAFLLSNAIVVPEPASLALLGFALPLLLRRRRA